MDRYACVQDWNFIDSSLFTFWKLKGKRTKKIQTNGKCSVPPFDLSIATKLNRESVSESPQQRRRRMSVADEIATPQTREQYQRQNTSWILLQFFLWGERERENDVTKKNDIKQLL